MQPPRIAMSGSREGISTTSSWCASNSTRYSAARIFKQAWLVALLFRFEDFLPVYSFGLEFSDSISIANAAGERQADKRRGVRDFGLYF